MQFGEQGVGASVTFSPRWWAFIGSTRIFVNSFCGQFFDEEFSSRVAMAAHELLENAAKYSRSPESPITCSFVAEQSVVCLTVVNLATPEQLAVRKAQFESVMAGDPLETYVAKMQQSFLSDQSQLGLARVRCLGGARLSLSVSDGAVKVEAVFDHKDGPVIGPGD